jgi:fibronectin-binding autotransporter adhesin
VENGGTLRVEGSAGSVFSSGDQRFGSVDRNDAVGRTIVRSGGRIIVDDPTFGAARFGDDEPDAASGSLATLLVEDAGSVLEASDFIQIGTNAGTGSTAAVATVRDGGTLRAPEVRLLRGGILTGRGGVLDGTLLVNGGLLAPGASPGRLTIDRDLRIAGGTVEIEIGGAGAAERDVLSILGDLIVEGAFDLDLRFVGGFMPAAGQSFDVFEVAGDIGDLASFARLSVTGGGGVRGSLLASGGGLAIVAQAAPVPLPATALLLGGALLGLGALARRKG